MEEKPGAAEQINSTWLLFMFLCGTVGFQTAPVSAVAQRPVLIDTQMFQCSAVHMSACQNLPVSDDGAAQVAVQKKYNSIVKIFVILQFKIGGSFGIVLQSAGIRDIFFKIGQLHPGVVHQNSVVYRLTAVI